MYPFQISRAANVSFGLEHRNASLQSKARHLLVYNSCTSNCTDNRKQDISFLNLRSPIFLLKIRLSQISWIIKRDLIIKNIF